MHLSDFFLNFAPQSFVQKTFDRIKSNSMNKLYHFLRHNRAVLWGLLLIIVSALAWLASQCNFEENIFQLLPKTGDETYRLTFTNLRLKDKIFVQAVYTGEEQLDEEFDYSQMADAMDLFINRITEEDNDKHYILHSFSEIDPLLLLDIADYAMLHGPAYTDLTPQQLDSLCSEEHIREQLLFYKDFLDTDIGANFYDVLSYDPCGISLAAASTLLASRQSTATAGVSPAEFLMSLSEQEENGPSRFMYNHIFTKGGKACIGFITPSFGTDNSKQAKKLLNSMDKVREEVKEAYPDIDILYHGTIVLAGGNSKRMRNDIEITVGVSMLIILIMLGIFLKRPTYLMLTVLALGFGILVALAGLYLVRGGVSIMSLGIGAIVLGVAFSYVLHILIHYIYTGNIFLTLDEQTSPVLLGSLTTIGAFAGLLFTQSQLLKDFGFFALLVIIGTTCFSLMVIPQFLPRKYTPNRQAFSFLEKVNSYNIDRNKTACIITFAWVLLCICFSGRYEFDSNLRNIGYISKEAAQAQDSWNSLMNEGYTQQYFASVSENTEDALEALPRIEKTIDSLRAEGLIVGGMKMSGIMPSLAVQQQRINNWHNYFTAERQAQVWHNIRKACIETDIDPDMFYPFKEIMALPEKPNLISHSRLLPPEILENFIEETHGNTLVYFPVKSTQENAMQVKKRLAAVEGCMVLDPYFYCTNLIELIHNDFNLIMWISSLFVFLLLLITYRNFWLTLIALIPMVLSWYTVLGAMALFGQPFNLVNIIVSSFVFGIGVDYSIFILEGLLKQGENNNTMTYNKTAITLSATILVICMFVLGFAVHPAIRSISFASLVGMITTIMLSYTLEPNLYRLYMYIKQRRAQKQQAGS